MLRLFTELPLRLVFSEVEWGAEKGGASEVPEVRVVDAWHVALDSGYVEPSVAVGSGHPGIVVIGPRGRGGGEQSIREWVSRAGMSLEPLRVFHKAHPDKRTRTPAVPPSVPPRACCIPTSRGGVIFFGFGYPMRRSTP